MNIPSLIKKLLLGIVMLAMLAGCATPTPTPVPIIPPIKVGPVTIDLVAFYDKANARYHRGLTDFEKPIQVAAADVKTTRTTFLNGVKDLLASRKQCFADVTKTESTIVAAAVTNTLPGQLASFLATNNLTGEQATTKCAEGYNKIDDYVMTNRNDIRNKTLTLYKLAVDYEAFFSDWIDVDLTQDLMDVYGDPSKVFSELAKHGIGVSDFVWIPTRLLAAEHSDKGICDYYMSGRFVSSLPMATKNKFKGHDDSLRSLYEATWIAPEDNGGVVGKCTMYRYAAIIWYKRIPTDLQTEGTLNSGIEKPAITFP